MTQVPSCFDRADGVTPLPPTNGLLGTPTPASAVKVQDASGTTTPSFNELPESPEIERAEQATITHTFKTTWSDALTRIVGLGRGTILFDSFGNETRVLSSRIQHLAGDIALLIVICEALSFDTPPDEFSCTPVELGINIIKHPRYFYALDPSANPFDTTIERQAKQAIILAIQTYQDSPFFPNAANVNSLISNNIINNLAANNVILTDISGAQTVYDATSSFSVQLAVDAAQEIITKLWKQIDNPYLVGYKIVWSQYYFKDPNLGTPEPLLYLNPGGYLENPITDASPSLPDYFGSTNGNYGTGGTIFDQIAVFNPQSYQGVVWNGAGANPPFSPGGLNISWLREADEVEFQRTWFKVSRVWIGSPVGNWDASLYALDSRPPNNSNPDNDFITLH